MIVPIRFLIFDNFFMTPQMLEERLIDFAVIIIGIVESLPNSQEAQKQRMRTAGRTSTFKNQHSSIIN
jgi:DNA gyrase inhibitor GyrI